MPWSLPNEGRLRSCRYGPRIDGDLCRAFIVSPLVSPLSHAARSSSRHGTIVGANGKQMMIDALDERGLHWSGTPTGTVDAALTNLAWTAHIQWPSLWGALANA